MRPSTTAISKRGISSDVRPQTVGNRQLIHGIRPSLQLQEELMEYNEGKRTTHYSIEPPKVRVKQYERMKIFTP